VGRRFQAGLRVRQEGQEARESWCRVRAAFHDDVAAVLLDDAVTARESEPGAVRLGREERIEHLAPRLLVHTDARVGHVQQRQTRGRTFCRALVDAHIEATSIRHRIARV